MGNLLQELRRRKVFRVAAVYAIVAWLIIQVAGEILPTFDAPQWVNQTLVLFLALGFPLALVLAWAFEMTPEGITSDAAVLHYPPCDGHHSLAYRDVDQGREQGAEAWAKASPLTRKGHQFLMVTAFTANS